MSSLPPAPEIRGGKGGAVPGGLRPHHPTGNPHFRPTPPAFNLDLVGLAGLVGAVAGSPAEPDVQAAAALDYSRWLHPVQTTRVIVVPRPPSISIVSRVHDIIQNLTGTRPQFPTLGRLPPIGPGASAGTRGPGPGGQAPATRPPFNPRLGTPPPVIRGLNGRFLPFQGVPNFPTEVQIPIQPANKGTQIGLQQSRVPVSQFATGGVRDRGSIAHPGSSTLSRLLFAVRAVRSGQPILVAAFSPLAIHEATNAFNQLNTFVAAKPSPAIARLITRGQLRAQLQAQFASAFYRRQHIPGKPRDC